MVRAVEGSNGTPRSLIVRVDWGKGAQPLPSPHAVIMQLGWGREGPSLPSAIAHHTHFSAVPLLGCSLERERRGGDA